LLLIRTKKRKEDCLTRFIARKEPAWRETMDELRAKHLMNYLDLMTRVIYIVADSDGDSDEKSDCIHLDQHICYWRSNVKKLASLGQKKRKFGFFL